MGAVTAGQSFGDPGTIGATKVGLAALDDALRDIDRKVFAERFDFLAELGSGGMGRVLKALDRKVHREVAIKRLKQASGWDPDLLARFVREARLTGCLNHPHIMTVYDILLDDEGPYLVLELIEGGSLAERLAHGAMPWKEAVDLLLPIYEAVAAAHARGIIHRDIKPLNILLTKSGVPKLGDFGIARSLESQGATLTGAVLGTLDYMAPEQMASSKTADERVDVYSLAATLYHMVTGETPRPISAEELPVELRSVMMKALQRKPENRPASVAEFALELTKIRRGVAVTEPDVPLNVETTPAAAKIATGSVAGERRLIFACGLAIPFRWCPPGSYLMGSPSSEEGHFASENQVSVELTRGFWMGESPVTQELYQAVMNNNPSQIKGIYHPVEAVSWDHAQSFCLALTKRLRDDGILDHNWRVSLPTEAQWEYACRAGTTTAFSFGNDSSQLAYFAWFGENSGAVTHPVGTRGGNPWGLHDMHGNVSEWCEDRYNRTLTGGINPTGQAQVSFWGLLNTDRVIRGGSYPEPARGCRSAFRFGAAQSSRGSVVGFRVCLRSD